MFDVRDKLDEIATNGDGNRATYITDAYREKQAIDDFERQDMELRAAEYREKTGKNIRQKKFGRFL